MKTNVFGIMRKEKNAGVLRPMDTVVKITFPVKLICVASRFPGSLKENSGVTIF